MKKIKQFQLEDRNELKREILETYNINEILDLLLDYASEDCKKDDSKPISVSKEDYERIMGMFKVKGYIGYGTDECKAESRGRKPKATPKPEK